MQYEKNRWVVDGETWLGVKLIHEQRVVDENGRWEMKKIAEWLDEVVRLKEWLLIMIHLCCGQLARGEELLGMRWCSSGEGEGRNVFVEDRDVVSVLRDHKGSWKGEMRVILRYFPREVGELMVWYIWLVVRCAEVWEKRWRERHGRGGDGDGDNTTNNEIESESESEDEERRKEGKSEEEKGMEWVYIGMGRIL